MKKCPYCGLANPDDATLCSTCKTELDPRSPEPIAPRELREYEMSPDEKRFWDKMTFRQFAVLIVRLQSLWLFFYAVLDLTYLPRYFPPAGYPGSRPWLTHTSAVELSMLILRIALDVGAGVFLIQATESILSWLVKDCIKPAAPAPAQS